MAARRSYERPPVWVIGSDLLGEIGQRTRPGTEARTIDCIAGKPAPTPPNGRETSPESAVPGIASAPNGRETSPESAVPGIASAPNARLWTGLGRRFRLLLDRRAYASLARSAAQPDGARPAGFSVSRMVVDGKGQPLLLLADRRGSALVVRAFRNYRAGHEAVLIASVEGCQASIRDIGCFAENGVNRGVGTALLRLAEELLNEAGVTSVTGLLASADADHRDRQVHFYLKNGYQVRLDGREGTIHKRLGGPAR